MPAGDLLKSTGGPPELFVSAETALIRLEPQRNAEPSDQERRPKNQHPSPAASDRKSEFVGSLCHGKRGVGLRAKYRSQKCPS